MQSRILNYFSSTQPFVKFVTGEVFRWNPAENYVEYVPDDSQEIEPALLLLHEIGHARLNHQDFHSDIDLLRKEVAAWTYAENVAEEINMNFNPQIAETCLDTYRYWIDKRSTCPNCQFTGYQNTHALYSCLNCKKDWKVNESQTARVCRITVGNIM